MAENMHMTPEMLEEKFPQIKDMIINTAMESYRKGEKACKNMYNVLLLDDYFEYFIILSGILYLFGLFLHSFSAVKFKYLINDKYISPYLIVLIIGIFGLVLNIILLVISSYISCGSSNYSSHFCHAIKYKNISFFVINETNVENITNSSYINNTYEDYKLITENYFDSYLAYKRRLYDDLHDKNKNSVNNNTVRNKVRRPKDGILEIIFSLTILPIFGFLKTIYDLNIIKELGVFQLLIPEVIYQFAKDVIIMIYKLVKGISDKTQVKQFIFIGVSNFCAIVGIAIYLELIEIRCYGLDENIKQNIIHRSLIDKEFALEEPDNKDEGRESDLYKDNEMIIN